MKSYILKNLFKELEVPVKLQYIDVLLCKSMHMLKNPRTWHFIFPVFPMVSIYLWGSSEWKQGFYNF